MGEGRIEHQVGLLKDLLAHLSTIDGNITLEYSNGDGVKIKMSKLRPDSPDNEPAACIGFQHPDADRETDECT